MKWSFISANNILHSYYFNKDYSYVGVARVDSLIFINRMKINLLLGSNLACTSREARPMHALLAVTQLKHFKVKVLAKWVLVSVLIVGHFSQADRVCGQRCLRLLHNWRKWEERILEETFRNKDTALWVEKNVVGKGTQMPVYHNGKDDWGFKSRHSRSVCLLLSKDVKWVKAVILAHFGPLKGAKERKIKRHKARYLN